MKKEGRGQRAAGGGPLTMALSALLVSMTLVDAACARTGSNAADSAAPSAAGDTVAVSASPDTARQPAPSDTSPPLRPPRPGDRAQSPSPPPARRPPPSPSDTARGIIAVVGATPITEVVLRPAGGQQITLTGTLAREIGVASGADVWVRGRRVDSRTIDVSSYAVRSVDGVTAITGTLTADGNRLVLVTDEGQRHPIARPPEPLRQHVGARIWITGDPGATISTYGVLRRPR